MELEKFCFCCKLRKGAFIWSILSIVFYLIVLITTVSSDLLSTENVTAVSVPDPNSYNNYKMPLYWTLLVSSIVHLISSILLSVAVWKKNHYLMLPWIIVNAICLIPVAFIALVGLLLAVPIVGPIYVWWCICSYYFKVQDDRTLFFQLVFDANN